MTVEDFHDLVQLLEEHPQWRAELRQLLLTEELLALPESVRALVAAQRRTEERVEELAAAQRRTEERVGELAAAQQRTEERVEQLVIATQQLVARTAKLTDDVGMLKGYVLERQYRERAPSYFAPLLRGIHALSSEEVARLVDGELVRAAVSSEDRREILETDLIIRGTRRSDGTDAYLAVEISAGIGRHDVTRAQRRAQVLQRLLSTPVLPVVAGEWITSEAEEQAVATHVWRVLDGRTDDPVES